jgi:c-di-GMP-related signal transduction protein
VKCDFPSLSVRERSELPNRFARMRIAALAEKVETHEEFEMAMNSGYSLFQGYFFCRPTVLTARSLPVNAVSYLRLLAALCRTEFDFDEVEGIIRVDPALSYRLLRVLNSYSFGFNTEVRSIRHALLLLGQGEFRKWGIVTTFCQAATSKPDQLMVTALCRARCCELLAPRLGCSSDEFFLAGLISLLDAILDIPRSELLQHLPVSASIHEALTKEGHAFADALALVMAYESGLFENCNSIRERLSLNEGDLARIYFDSVNWAEQASGRQA